jgi:uncharacterized membrane protein required for colicin V production
MGSIEILFYTVVLIFGFIGLVRGVHRELGNAIIFMAVVAILGLANNQGWIERVVQALTSALGADAVRTAEITFMVYATILVLVVIITYQGVVFDFSAKPVTGFWGGVLGFIVGAFNGYLIAGTLWFYADKYQYPFGLLTGPLTPTGTLLLQLSPLTIFPNPVFWAVPATVLLIMRVWR